MKRVHKTGAMRMAETGRKQVQVWLSAAELAAVTKNYPRTKVATAVRMIICEHLSRDFWLRDS